MGYGLLLMQDVAWSSQPNVRMYSAESDVDEKKIQAARDGLKLSYSDCSVTVAWTRRCGNR